MLLDLDSSGQRRAAVAVAVAVGTVAAEGVFKCERHVCQLVTQRCVCG